jgi:hypothetical protein
VCFLFKCVCACVFKCVYVCMPVFVHMPATLTCEHYVVVQQWMQGCMHCLDRLHHRFCYARLIQADVGGVE